MRDAAELARLRSEIEQVRQEMLTIARVAGQCSVEGPEDRYSLMAAAEADRCSKWADRLLAALARGGE